MSRNLEKGEVQRLGDAFWTREEGLLVLEGGDGETASDASDGAECKSFKEEETFGIMAKASFIMS